MAAFRLSNSRLEQESLLLGVDTEGSLVHDHIERCCKHLYPIETSLSLLKRNQEINLETIPSQIMCLETNCVRLEQIMESVAIALKKV